MLFMNKVVPVRLLMVVSPEPARLFLASLSQTLIFTEVSRSDVSLCVFRLISFLNAFLMIFPPSDLQDSPEQTAGGPLAWSLRLLKIQ